MNFLYKDREYQVEVIRKNNKNTYIRVRDGIIYVTTNYWVRNRQIERLLKENHRSIEKMIERDVQSARKRELFLVFGEYYDVVYGDFDQLIKVEPGHIWVQSEEILIKWVDRLIETTYHSHLKHWHSVFEEEIPVPNLVIKKMKTRWGVCNTRNHNVTLNFELFRFDMECLDYVIVHELAHFLVPNHSKKFWKIVEKYCPNYKEIRKKLRS